MQGNLAAAFASIALRFGDRARSALNTMAARGQARMGPGARMGPNGRVQNIGRDRDKIEIGDHSFIDGEVLTFAHAGAIRIGKWCFVGRHSFIWSSAEIVIGDRVLISHQVNIHDTNSHPLDPVERAQQTREILTKGHPESVTSIKAAPIRIGNDAWIGYGASIARGVTIGERAIIGAQSFVDCDVLPDTIFKGSGAL